MSSTLSSGSDSSAYPMRSRPTASAAPRLIPADPPLIRKTNKGGCWTCRLRRKKCDEQREGDTCQTCKRLSIKCLGWGTRRPEWMRDKKAVEEYRTGIREQLLQAGLIRGQSQSQLMSRNPPSRAALAALAAPPHPPIQDRTSTSEVPAAAQSSLYSIPYDSHKEFSFLASASSSNEPYGFPEISGTSSPVFDDMFYGVPLENNEMGMMPMVGISSQSAKWKERAVEREPMPDPRAKPAPPSQVKTHYLPVDIGSPSYPSYLGPQHSSLLPPSSVYYPGASSIGTHLYPSLLLSAQGRSPGGPTSADELLSFDRGKASFSPPTMDLDKEPASILVSYNQSQQTKEKTSALNEPRLDPILLLERLSSLLKDRTTREALHNLQKDQAQLLIDCLHSVLEEKAIALESGLRKAILFLLYKICRTTLLYPHCYVLQDISRGLHKTGGGFSDIYNGQFGKQQLCLKVVRVFQKSATDAILGMYAKEAIIWGSLSHPNVVPFYGVYYWNEERRQICLVSPWFSDGNLVEYLRQHPSTPRVPLIHDVSLGLEYLHGQGLVHGDIKGVNILVDGFGRACLADLGLSSIRTDQTLFHSMHATTVSALSFRWAAPELTGESARFTVASDMWAFGCVCYEASATILTGELPFSSIQSDMQIIFKLISGSLPGTLDTIADIHEHENIREVIEGCWAREPAARPLSDEVVRKLGASLRAMEGDEEESRRRIRKFRNAMKAKAVLLDLAQIDQILDRVCVHQPTEEMSSR